MVEQPIKGRRYRVCRSRGFGESAKLEVCCMRVHEVWGKPTEYNCKVLQVIDPGGIDRVYTVGAHRIFHQEHFEAEVEVCVGQDYVVSLECSVGSAAMVVGRLKGVARILKRCLGTIRQYEIEFTAITSATGHFGDCRVGSKITVPEDQILAMVL